MLKGDNRKIYNLFHINVNGTDKRMDGVPTYFFNQLSMLFLNK